MRMLVYLQDRMMKYITKYRTNELQNILAVVPLERVYNRPTGKSTDWTITHG